MARDLRYIDGRHAVARASIVGNGSSRSALALLSVAVRGLVLLIACVEHRAVPAGAVAVERQSRGRGPQRARRRAAAACSASFFSRRCYWPGPPVFSALCRRFG